MANTGRSRTHALSAPQRIFVATLGLGLACLATMAAFALAFQRPSASGWAGFAVIAAIVLAATTGIGQLLARNAR